MQLNAFYICMHVNEFSLVPWHSLAIFRCCSCFIKVPVFSQQERRHDLMCCWKQAFLWSLQDQTLESGDLWNKKLSVTETSEAGHNTQSFCKHATSGGLSLRWSDPICLKVIGLIRVEARRGVQGTWALCGHTRLRLYGLLQQTSLQHALKREKWLLVWASVNKSELL